MDPPLFLGMCDKGCDFLSADVPLTLNCDHVLAEATMRVEVRSLQSRKYIVVSNVNRSKTQVPGRCLRACVEQDTFVVCFKTYPAYAVAGLQATLDPSHSFRFQNTCQTNSILEELPYTDGSGDIAYLTVRDGKPAFFSAPALQGTQKVTLVANRIEAGTKDQRQVMVFENSNNILFLRRNPAHDVWEAGAWSMYNSINIPVQQYVHPENELFLLATSTFGVQHKSRLIHEAVLQLSESDSKLLLDESFGRYQFQQLLLPRWEEPPDLKVGEGYAFLDMSAGTVTLNPSPGEFLSMELTKYAEWESLVDVVVIAHSTDDYTIVLVFNDGLLYQANMQRDGSWSLRHRVDTYVSFTIANAHVLKIGDEWNVLLLGAHASDPEMPMVTHVPIRVHHSPIIVNLAPYQENPEILPAESRLVEETLSVVSGYKTESEMTFSVPVDTWIEIGVVQGAQAVYKANDYVLNVSVKTLVDGRPVHLLPRDEWFYVTYTDTLLFKFLDIVEEMSAPSEHYTKLVRMTVSTPDGQSDTLFRMSLRCPAGSSIAGASTTMCVPCPADTYRTWSMASGICEPCPEHSVTVVTAGAYTSELCACDLGAYYDEKAAGASKCVPCPAKTFKDFVGNQTFCPGNCGLKGSANYVEGAKSAEQLKCICTFGEYVKGSACVPCPVGSYCPNGSEAVTCPANSTTSKTGATNEEECTCIAGAQREEDGCGLCPIGMYNPSIGSKCRPCGIGTMGPLGAVSFDECNKCKPGYYLGSGGHCAICPPGSWCPGGDEILVRYAAGHTSEAMTCGTAVPNSVGSSTVVDEGQFFWSPMDCGCRSGSGLKGRNDVTELPECQLCTLGYTEFAYDMPCLSCYHHSRISHSTTPNSLKKCNPLPGFFMEDVEFSFDPRVESCRRSDSPIILELQEETSILSKEFVVRRETRNSCSHTCDRIFREYCSGYSFSPGMPGSVNGACRLYFYGLYHPLNVTPSATATEMATATESDTTEEPSSTTWPKTEGTGAFAACVYAGGTQIWRRKRVVQCPSVQGERWTQYCPGGSTHEPKLCPPNSEVLTKYSVSAKDCICFDVGFSGVLTQGYHLLEQCQPAAVGFFTNYQFDRDILKADSTSYIDHSPLNATPLVACINLIANSTTPGTGSSSVADCVCAPGYYEQRAGNSFTCEPCAQGFYCTGGTAPPTACVMSDTVEGVPATALEDCNCFAGWTFVQRKCQPCGIGLIKSIPGNFACPGRCKAGALTIPSATSDTMCYCEEGTYMTGGGDCLPCPVGAYCKGKFDDDMWNQIQAAFGHPDLMNQLDIKLTNHNMPSALPGYYEYRPPNDSALYDEALNLFHDKYLAFFLRCAATHWCRGSQDGVDVQCSEGHESTLCSQCAPGFFRHDPTSACQRCSRLYVTTLRNIGWLCGILGLMVVVRRVPAGVPVLRSMLFHYLWSAPVYVMMAQSSSMGGLFPVVEVLTGGWNRSLMLRPYAACHMPFTPAPLRLFIDVATPVVCYFGVVLLFLLGSLVMGHLQGNHSFNQKLRKLIETRDLIEKHDYSLALTELDATKTFQNWPDNQAVFIDNLEITDDDYYRLRDLAVIHQRISQEVAFLRHERMYYLFPRYCISPWERLHCWWDTMPGLMLVLLLTQPLWIFSGMELLLCKNLGLDLGYQPVFLDHGVGTCDWKSSAPWCGVASVLLSVAFPLLVIYKGGLWDNYEDPVAYCHFADYLSFYHVGQRQGFDVPGWTLVLRAGLYVIMSVTFLFDSKVIQLEVSLLYTLLILVIFVTTKPVDVLADPHGSLVVIGLATCSIFPMASAIALHFTAPNDEWLLPVLIISECMAACVGGFEFGIRYIVVLKESSYQMETYEKKVPLDELSELHVSKQVSTDAAEVMAVMLAEMGGGEAEIKDTPVDIVSLHQRIFPPEAGFISYKNKRDALCFTTDPEKELSVKKAEAMQQTLAELEEDRIRQLRERMALESRLDEVEPTRQSESPQYPVEQRSNPMMVFFSSPYLSREMPLFDSTRLHSNLRYVDTRLRRAVVGRRNATRLRSFPAIYSSVWGVQSIIASSRKKPAEDPLHLDAVLDRVQRQTESVLSPDYHGDAVFHSVEYFSRDIESNLPFNPYFETHFIQPPASSSGKLLHQVALGLLALHAGFVFQTDLSLDFMHVERFRRSCYRLQTLPRIMIDDLLTTFIKVAPKSKIEQLQNRLVLAEEVLQSLMGTMSKEAAVEDSTQQQKEDWKMLDAVDRLMKAERSLLDGVTACSIARGNDDDDETKVASLTTVRRQVLDRFRHGGGLFEALKTYREDSSVALTDHLLSCRPDPVFQAAPVKKVVRKPSGPSAAPSYELPLPPEAEAPRRRRPARPPPKRVRVGRAQFEELPEIGLSGSIEEIGEEDFLFAEGLGEPLQYIKLDEAIRQLDLALETPNVQESYDEEAARAVEEIDKGLAKLAAQKDVTDQYEAMKRRVEQEHDIRGTSDLQQLLQASAAHTGQDEALGHRDFAELVAAERGGSRRRSILEYAAAHSDDLYQGFAPRHRRSET